MWRNLFRRRHRFVEVIGPSSQKLTMSHDEFVARMVEENRLRMAFAHHGLIRRTQIDRIVDGISRVGSR